MHHHGHGCGERGDWRAARRGFGGFGRGFGPFGGPGMGGRGRGGGNAFRIGRMLADGDLRLIVLALLEESPRHGYEIIKALEEKSSGFYSPSPGVVYPTLTFLEETGFASSASDGNKKVYSITDAGRAHLNENRDVAETVLNGIEKIGKKLSRAREWFDWSDREGDGERPSRPDRDIPDVLPEVNDARRELKAAIAEKLESPADEQRRVARILRDAAAAIRGAASDKNPSEPIDLG
jgi:DNA-binding PadR family transcriptional regulator